MYIKSGSIIPFGPQVQYATEKKWDNLEIKIYPGANGNFVLYEDENDNYNYEKGAYSTIGFSWDDAKKTLTISDRKGSFTGMLTERNFNVKVVGSGKANVSDKNTTLTKTISYNGKQVAVKL